MAPPEEDASDNFAATTLDREAMSFPDLEPSSSSEAAEAASDKPEREVSGPKWAGTLPGLERDPEPGPPPPPPMVVPAAAPRPPAPAQAPPPDPIDLAATSLHQKLHTVEAPTAPPLDQLREDRRVAEAGRKAGLRSGAAGPDTEDQLLKIGLVVIAVLIALLVVAVCAGVGSSLLEPLPEEDVGAMEMTLRSVAP